MRSSYLLGILLTTFTATTLAAMSTGCGDGSGGSSSNGTAGSGGSGGDGGGGGMSVDNDGNTSCAEAVAIDLSGMDFPDKLDPVASDKDYFKVKLTKGQAIYFGTTAKPDIDPYGDAYPDTVITLYSEDGKTQIARNDDMSGSNNSELMHLVPADGTYCVEVADCYAIFGPDVCADPAGISNFDYSLFAFELDPNAESVTLDVEPNDTTQNATPLKLASFKDNTGALAGYQTLGWGTFSSATDKDLYSYAVANDFPVDPAGRSLCLFEFYELGTEGNGSTATTGLLAKVATKANPNAIIAEVDLGIPDLTFGYVEMPTITMPCTKGTDYIFTLERAPGEAAGASDFYFYSMLETGSNRIEKEPNNTTPEPLDLTPTDDGTGYVTGIGGDITTVGMGGDIDMFAINVPQGNWLASAFCYAQRDGSGLRGLQVTLTDGSNTPLKNGTGVEAVDHFAYADSALVPAGTAEIRMHVKADSQDPNVSSKYYFCSLGIFPQ